MTPCIRRATPALFPLALAAALTLAACSGDTDAPAAGAPVVEVGGALPASPAAQAGVPPSVTDLMARAGCVGGVIEPQLYTREVGRCTLQGQEVDVASFDSNDLRDQWAEFARTVGGTTVTGELWAASSIGAAGAEGFAAAIG